MNPTKKSFRNSLSLFVKFVVDFIVFNNDFQQIFNTPSLSHFLLNKISLLNTFSATNLDTLVNKIMRSFKLSMINNYIVILIRSAALQNAVLCIQTVIYTLMCKTNSKFEARINLYQNN